TTWWLPVPPVTAKRVDARRRKPTCTSTGRLSSQVPPLTIASAATLPSGKNGSRSSTAGKVKVREAGRPALFFWGYEDQHPLIAGAVHSPGPGSGCCLTLYQSGL